MSDELNQEGLRAAAEAIAETQGWEWSAKDQDWRDNAIAGAEAAIRAYLPYYDEQKG